MNNILAKLDALRTKIYNKFSSIHLKYLLSYTIFEDIKKVLKYITVENNKILTFLKAIYLNYICFKTSNFFILKIFLKIYVFECKQM